MEFQTSKIQIPREGTLAVGTKEREIRVGEVLWDRYEILASLGSSALGDLWRCKDWETQADVSLRWLPPDMRRSKSAMAVIHAGIKRISGQQHPNLAVIRQMIYVGDQIFLVGDFAPGIDIGTWGEAGPGGKRPLEEVLPVLRQVADGLDFAHSRRIVHRNLKPSDIFLGPDGVVRVTDFGLDMHHHLTIFHGEAVRSETTGAYLAPELRQGEDPDSASDQYALGVLAWKLLVGVPPKPNETGNPPKDLPAAARAALRRVLSPKPRNRFVTCKDFVKALEGAKVEGTRKRSAAEWRHIGIRVGIGAGLLAVAGGLMLAGSLLASWLDKPRTPAAKAEPPPPKEVVDLPPAVAEAPKEKVFEHLVAATAVPVEGQPWVTQTAGMEFVWVPALELWVGRFEVTNDEYRQKVPDHDSGDFRGMSLREPRQAVVRVNFDDTVAFAAWLTEQERAAGKLPEGWRYRLPSRTEATAYTLAGKMQSYPWGELWPPSRGNYADAALKKDFPDLPFIPEYHDGFPVTAPVEESGENGWGMFGAGGNVWETTTKVAGGPLFGGWQGGGWDDCQPARMKCDVVYGFMGNARGAVNGFRLLLAPISGEVVPLTTNAVPAAVEAPGS